MLHHRKEMRYSKRFLDIEASVARKAIQTKKGFFLPTNLPVKVNKKISNPWPLYVLVWIWYKHLKNQVL